MDVATLQAHCLAKPGAWPDNPWEHEHPVIKVHEKIFAFLGADSVGVKAGATREVADEWLDRYPRAASVMRYLGRSGWNSLDYAGIPDDDLLEEKRLEIERALNAVPARANELVGRSGG